MKKLVLAEKPSQGQDIARGLDDRFEKKDGYLEGSKYIITWAYGHLVQLAEPSEYDEKYRKWKLEDLPILPERFRYVVTKDKYKQFKVIKELVNRSDVKECLICTDPGREGELIARLILMKAGNKKPVYRFWTSKALTPDAVREGFQNLKPASEFDRLYESALARQRADWLVGLNATRAWSVKGKTLLSIGRVQTAVLKLLCDRENEIRNFKPKDYWLVRAQFQKDHDQYEGVWIGQDGKDENTPEAETEVGQTEEDSESTHSRKRIDREELAKEIQRRITGSQGVVRTVRQKLKQELPPLLFSLTVLQQEANRLFGFSADKTLKLAQELYEAKLTTYPRTESQHLNEEMVDECIKIINSLKRFGNISETFRFDPEKCRVEVKNKRVFDSKKLTDHHALIPTGRLPERRLAPDEMKLFELICRRFIAAFYPAYKYRSTTIITVVGRDVFLSQGKAVVDLGWKEVYGGKEKDQILPELHENDRVVVRNSEVEKKQTKPPSRYTDASILKAMTSAHKFVKDERLKKILKENAGVGTPASIPYHMTVVVMESGIIKILPIGEFIDRFISSHEGSKEVNGCFTLSFTDEGKVRWLPISYVHKHIYDGPIFEITLENMAKIEVTKYHNLFVLRDSEIKLIPSNNIKKGDYIIVPEKINLPEIDDYDYLDEDIAFLVGLFISEGNFSYTQPIKRIKLSVDSIYKISKKIEETKGIKKLKEVHCYYNLRKTGGILVKNLLALLKVLGMSPDEIPETSLIGTRKVKRIFLNLSERHLKNGVVDYVKNICKRKGYGIGEYYIKNSKEIKYEIKSKELIRIFTELGLVNGAYNKRIPNQFYTANKNIKTALLKGLLSGDASIRLRNGNKRSGIEVNYYSSNRLLIIDIYFLLNSFGIIPSIHERISITRGKKFKGYILSISSSYYLRNIIDAIPDHFKKEKEFIINSDTHDKKGIPLVESGLINLYKLRTRETTSLPKRYKRLSKKVLNRLVKEIEKKKGIEAIENIGVNRKLIDFYLKGNILFLKVRDIKIVRGGKEVVYDFSIPMLERFLAGDMIFVHNTRAQILETLKQRGYITRKGKSLMVTDKGMELIKVIGDEKIADVGYTALWEQELERIARGEVKSSEAFMKSIISYTKELIEKAKGVSLNISNSKQSIGKCPECGADVYEGNKSYYCSKWKDGCKFTIWKGHFEPLGKKTITVNQAKALIAGKTITLKWLKSKKTGKKFNSKARLTKNDKYGWTVELVFEKTRH